MARAKQPLGTSTPKKSSYDPTVKKPSKSDSFPLVSVLGRADMNRVIEIMKDDAEYAEQEKALKEVRRMLKDELVQIGMTNDVPGLRWGPFVAYIRGMKTTRTMSAEKLKVKWAEAGLDLAELEECYQESDPWPDVRIVDTSKPTAKKWEESLERK